MSEHNSHPDHGSLKSYMTGFVLSVILTAIPFWLVMANVIESAGLTALIILAFAAVQIFVHMIYFRSRRVAGIYWRWFSRLYWCLSPWQAPYGLCTTSM